MYDRLETNVKEGKEIINRGEAENIIKYKVVFQRYILVYTFRLMGGSIFVKLFLSFFLVFVEENTTMSLIVA